VWGTVTSAADDARNDMVVPDRSDFTELICATVCAGSTVTHRKIVNAIRADKAKSQAYCQINSFGGEIDLAAQAKDEQNRRSDRR
jgi:hypothetical protein